MLNLGGHSSSHSALMLKACMAGTTRQQPAWIRGCRKGAATRLDRGRQSGLQLFMPSRGVATGPLAHLTVGEWVCGACGGVHNQHGALQLPSSCSLCQLRFDLQDKPPGTVVSAVPCPQSYCATPSSRDHDAPQDVRTCCHDSKGSAAPDLPSLSRDACASMASAAPADTAAAVAMTTLATTSPAGKQMSPLRASCGDVRPCSAS